MTLFLLVPVVARDSITPKEAKAADDELPVGTY
jgi:hypothetical protein